MNRSTTETSVESARERILRTAYELQSRHGLRAVGVDRISEEAGVAKMTLYRHFRSKEELALAVLERREQTWSRGWLERTASCLAATVTPRRVGRCWRYAADPTLPLAVQSLRLCDIDPPRGGYQLVARSHRANLQCLNGPAPYMVGLTIGDDCGEPCSTMATTTTISSSTTTTTLPSADTCSPGESRECEGITGRPVGRLVDFPPSLPIASCVGGNTSSNYLTPKGQLDESSTEELHVIGVYEGALPGGGSRGFQEHPQGVIDVTVRNRPKPVVLYLGSYEPELWRLHLDPGAHISRIFTFGYYEQVVDAPAGVPVTVLGYNDGVSCMYGWELAESEGGCPFFDTMVRVRQLTGLVESSFQGCYAGDHFVVPHSDGPPQPCQCSHLTGDETIELRDVSLPGCEDLKHESQYCLTSAGGTLAVLGLDSGTVCPLTAGPGVASDPISPTLAWRGEAAYACVSGAGLVRASLQDGTVDVGQMPCTAVTVDDAGRLVVSTAPHDGSDSRTSLYAFESWPDALAGRAVTVYPGSGFGLLPERLTVRDGVVYTAWHSTNTIERSDLVTGQALASVTLQGYDGSILGLSVTGDGRMVIPGDIWGSTVRVFDRATGELDEALTPAVPVTGVACVDRR